MDPFWTAMLTIAAMGGVLAVYAAIQEHFFQKEIERQKREGTYPYAPGMSPAEQARKAGGGTAEA